MLSPPIVIAMHSAVTEHPPLRGGFGCFVSVNPL
jgi:hypothetical protein